ncbi:MAG: molybdenum cofactor biosynthesis protein MoaE, partial [Candidatus Kryptonium sp.]
MAENLKYITFERIDINFIPDVFTGDFHDCGSVVIFEGRVRADKIDNAVVEKIIYESYIEMAEKEFEEIEKEIKTEYAFLSKIEKIDNAIIVAEEYEMPSQECSFSSVKILNTEKYLKY